jgi:cytoskeleton protein RodZ
MSEFGAGAVADDVTAGTLLRRAREAAGLHIATLAVSLKVPVRKLEALEEDRYDQLSDAVFVRALASSVCRTLKIDAQPILERLPQGGKPRLVQDSEGINAPFRVPGDGPKPAWTQAVLRPVPLSVAVLLVGALVIVLWPGVRQRDEAPATEATRTEAVIPPNGAPQGVVVSPAEPILSLTQTATTTVPAPVTGTGAPAAAAQAPAAASVPTPAPAASAAGTAKPAAAASAPATPLPTTGTVVFRAKGPSWVQVTDAKGQAVLRRLMEPGETVGASGALPLSVTVGSVQATEVQVRGRPFDLNAVARDNVARFEVK